MKTPASWGVVAIQSRLTGRAKEDEGDEDGDVADVLLEDSPGPHGLQEHAEDKRNDGHRHAGGRDAIGAEDVFVVGVTHLKACQLAHFAERLTRSKKKSALRMTLRPARHTPDRSEVARWTGSAQTMKGPLSPVLLEWSPAPSSAVGQQPLPDLALPSRRRRVARSLPASVSRPGRRGRQGHLG
eukprot:756838-Hanusia_phi.AAC.2